MRCAKAFLVFVSLAVSNLLLAAGQNGQFDGKWRDVTPLYFGMHFHGLVASPGRYKPTRWPSSMQFGTIRLWDSGTRWADVAPRPGEWKFDRLDFYVEQAQARQAQVLYVLGSTPRWASARPDEPCAYGWGCSAEPIRMAHWEEYVRRIAERYRGKIKAYELWNEPNVLENVRDRTEMQGSFFTGSVVQLVEMARIARKVLDEVDPTAILTTPGVVNAPAVLQKFLETGGKRYVQVVSYHFYSHDARQFLRQVAEVREIMRKQGVSGLPLWNSETGLEVWPSGPLPPGAIHLDHDQAAALTAQFLILGLAAGLDRFYYYAWDNGRSGMVTPQGEPLPEYFAMERLQRWLIGSTFQGCTSFVAKGMRCAFERGAERFWVVWIDERGRHSFALPKGWRLGTLERLYGDPPEVVTDVTQDQVMIPLDMVPLRLELLPVSSNEYPRSPRSTSE